MQLKKLCVVQLSHKAPRSDTALCPWSPETGVSGRKMQSAALYPTATKDVSGKKASPPYRQGNIFLTDHFSAYSPVRNNGKLD